MDTIKLLAIGAGFVVILGAIGLTWRQGTVTWQHVVVFCLGAVLAGISGVSAQGGVDGKWEVTIGQIAKAANETTQATSDQANAIAALSQRVEQLQTEIQSLRVSVAASARPGQPPPPPPAPPVASAEVQKNLNSSRDSVRRSLQILRTLPAF
jgi:hypothetical protein